MKFKRTTRHNIENHATQNKVTEKKSEKDWFAEQYEKLIGKPLPRKELTTEEVIKKLQDATKYRWIPEAKAYKGSMPEMGPAHYFEWKEPEVNKCTCLDSDCTCKGDLMFPRKKIPRGKRYFKSPILQKIIMKLTKSDKTPNSTPNFTQRLAELIETEAELYKDMEKRGDLRLRGAEFCFSRCIRFYGPARLQESKHDTDAQKPRVEELKTPELKENADNGDRKHDGFAYTVSTPPPVAPCPELGYSTVFQDVYGSTSKAILKDINGTRLHISSIECSGDEPNVLLRGYDKLLSFGEALNMKELRNKLHILKQNIYSSINEIKDNKPTLQSTSTQYDDNVPSDKLEGNKSSEGITIATPYKGVTVKVKKKPTNSDVRNRDISQLDDKISPLGLCEKIHSAEIKKSNTDITHEISIKDMITKSLMMAKLETKSSMTATVEQKMKLTDSIVNPVKTNECINEAERSKTSTQNSVFDPQSVILKEALDARSNIQIIANNKNDSRLREEVEQLVTLNKCKYKSFEIKVNETDDEINAQSTKHFLKTKYYGFSLDQLHSSKIKRFIKFLRNEKLLSPPEHSIQETESDEKITKLMINSVQKISDKQSYKEELSLPQNENNVHFQLNIADKSSIKMEHFSGTEKQGDIDKDVVVSSQNVPSTTSILNDGTNVKQAKEDSKELEIQSKCYMSSHNVTLSPANSTKSTEFNESENLNKIKENKRSNESKKNNVETSSKIPKNKEEKSELDDQNIENLCVYKNSEFRNQESLTKTLLKLSSLLKRAHPEKKNNGIKSLPESQQRNFKSDQIDANCGANKIDFKQYQYNKEPKTSEKEMFSIQYSYGAVGKNERSKKSLQINT